MNFCFFNDPLDAEALASDERGKLTEDFDKCG